MLCTQTSKTLGVLHLYQRGFIKRNRPKRGIIPKPMTVIQPNLTATQTKERPTKKHWWRQDQEAACQAAAPKPGDRCPECGLGKLDYDSLFLLTCDHCGQVVESSAFT